MLQDLLRRSLPGSPEPLYLPAPDWARRQRIQLHWDGTALGFHQRGSNHIVPVDCCPLADDLLSTAIPVLRSSLQRGELPDSVARWELATGTPAGDVRCWPAQHGENYSATDIISPSDPALQAWRLDGRAWVADTSPLLHRFENFSLQQPPGNFMQACPPWAEAAFSALFAQWPLDDTTLYDLYGGLGFFSLLLSQRYRSCVLVESNPISTETARINLSALDAQVITAPVEDWLPAQLGADRDTILLDPPRSGLPLRVAETLLSARAGSLVLIGCDGAAFCRDAKRLSASWELKQLAAIDLFPNTVQLELTGLFQRRG